MVVGDIRLVKSICYKLLFTHCEEHGGSRASRIMAADIGASPPPTSLETRRLRDAPRDEIIAVGLKAFSSEVHSGSREENASKHKIRASVLVQG
jgi:hypothetical protein